MKAWWVLTRLRMLEILRVPGTVLFFFGMPLVMLAVTAMIFAHGQPYSGCRLGLVGGQPGYAGLTWEPVASPEMARIQLGADQLRAVVLVKDGTTTIWVTAGERLVGEGLRANLPAPVTLEVVQRPPWGFVHYVFPGVLAFAIVMSGLFGLGYSLARYRQSSFLRKLATTPLGKSTFIASQIAGRGALVLLQCVLLLGAVQALCGLTLSLVQLGWTLLITLSGLLAFLGIGFVLACLVSSEGVLYDVISALGWPLVLGSEMFFPAAALPAPLAMLTGVLPSTLLVRLLRSVLLYNHTSWGTLGPSLAGLLVWSALTLAMGRLYFRWNDP